ncbi:MAG: sulfur carrier protein ThiS [Deltaproteobacteria bacterium]|nr:sulfur carrier protein ThiS [Deltaproteobacteria bacterium]
MSSFRSQKSEVRSQKIKTFINGAMREVATGTTVLDLLNELDIKPHGMAVELNLEIVSKSKFAETVLKDGDKVEIVRMVGGG